MPYDPQGPGNPEYPGSQPPQQPQQPQPQYPPQYPQPGAGYPPYPQTGPGYPQYPQSGPAQPAQPEYGQPPYQQAGYGAPTPPGAGYPGAYPPGYAPAPSPRRSNRGLVIGLSIAGGIVLCIALCIAVVYGGGLFLRTAGTSISTSLYATETAIAQQSQATPTVSETILYQDSMSDSPSGWSSDTACVPESDGYHVKGGTVCIGPDAASSANVDITVTVQGKTTSTNTSYAVAFRHQSSGNFYSFEITPDGQWAVLKFTNGTASPVSDFQSSTAILTGAGATNTMRVLAVGSHFVLFVNGQQVGVADDATFSNGGMGLGNDDSDSTSDVVFTNLTVGQPQG